MKTLLTLILLLLNISFLSAQDQSLPKGNSTIYLHSGKIIKKATLWKIDSLTVEFALKGNLADVKTIEVSKIETLDFVITFNQHHQMKTKGYDTIILTSKDTLRGVIQRIDDRVISYQPVGSDKIKRVMKGEVESYSQWHEEASHLTDSISHPGSTKIIYQTPDEEDSTVLDIPVLTEGDDRDKEEKEFYYHQSYERGVSDAIVDKNKSAGWGGSGLVLGATIGSPFLFLGAANSKVKIDKVPEGVDEKLYREAFQNEIVRKRSKRAAAGAIAGKCLILIILIASL